MSTPSTGPAGGWGWVARNGPAVAVTLGAAAATAHGLYEVAHAAKVPSGIAWLYPLVTDGLAMVAYRATSRLSGTSAGYAWTCVVLAAGLSGLAQAVYLAADTVQADPALRFGVGAWPAVACALVAHLLHLTLTTDTETDTDTDTDTAGVGNAAATGGAGPVVEGPGPAPASGHAVRVDASDVPAPPKLPEQLVIEATCRPGANSDDDTDTADVVGRADVVDKRPDPEAGEAAEVVGDGRVRLLGELLAAGADVTGPQAAVLLSHHTGAPVSDRTARRLLATARDGTDQHPDSSPDPARAGEELGDRRARLVLLPTGTSTTHNPSTTSGSTSEGEQR